LSAWTCKLEPPAVFVDKARCANGYDDTDRNAALPGNGRLLRVRAQHKPLALHAQAVLQLRQREDVNERPNQPGEETTGVQSAPSKYRVILIDDSHVALIEMAERMYDVLPFQLFQYRPS
jgi:hypothetical protein